MIVTLEISKAKTIKRKNIVCELIRNRIILVLGQKSNRIRTVIFCDNLQNDKFRLEKLKKNQLNLYIHISLLKKALQTGEGQKNLDEMLLLIKNQIIN